MTMPSDTDMAHEARATLSKARPRLDAALLHLRMAVGAHEAAPEQ